MINKRRVSRPTVDGRYQLDLRIAFLTIALVAGTPFADAQGHIELTPFFGYTESEGIEVNPQPVNGVSVNRLTPKSDYSFGFEEDYQDDAAGWGVGFLFNQQSGELELGL